MSLGQRLLDDMKTAMKAGEAGKERLSVIRMVRAAIKNKEIDLRRELDEAEILDVVTKEVKQRRDAIEEFKKGDRSDLVAKNEAEIALLSDYLPRQLTEAEIRELVREAIAATGASGPKEMGKVMTALMPKTKGRADGKLVNQIVKELLG